MSIFSALFTERTFLMVKITSVLHKSRAERVGICEGDVLLSINGNEINDVLDYRFYLADTVIDLSLTRDGKPFSARITKSEYDDIGLGFETPLMDKKRSCHNKCIFCFIDQLPKGLRESLYFKDDDSRLSFLHGNYITLTNLKDEDIDRIIKMHISPVNVSVHTTNPALRVEMMKNKRAGEVLSYLDKLKDAGITICAQIVLCKGVNDKDELLRSMRDLKKLFPALNSCSIVPAGLTKFRDGLYHLEAFTKEECLEVIHEILAFGDECLKELGTRLFYPADEFYISAGIEIPDNEFYEEYAQIENGVGMIRSFDCEFKDELDYLTSVQGLSELKEQRHVTVATGYSSYEMIKNLCDLAESSFKNLKIDVIKIKNNFFGDSITVSGLMTGKDLSLQLKSFELGDELLLPSSTLRAEGDLFLCGMTPEELSKKLGVNIRFVRNDGADFLQGILGDEAL